MSDLNKKKQNSRGDGSVSREDYILAAKLGNELMECLYGVKWRKVSVSDKAKKESDASNKLESNVASCSVFQEGSLGEGNNMDISSENETLNEEEEEIAYISSEVDDQIKLNCMKCKKDGEVLVCSLSDCSVVVHESCMGIPARYDDKGDFRCPGCVYALATSRFDESVRRLSFTRAEVREWWGWSRG